MRGIRYIIIFAILCTGISVAIFSLKNLLHRTSDAIPKMEITQWLDNENALNVHVTRSQIKKEITPIVIEEFLSRTRIASSDGGGLELADFDDDSVLARYGFRRGDVVKEIDGQEINNTQEAIKACDALEKEILGSRDEKEINIALNRGGEDISIKFRVPKFVPQKVRYTMNLQKRSER